MEINWNVEPIQLTQLVEQVFVIEDMTYGGHQQGFLARYHGMLRSSDSEKSHSWLSEQLKPQSLLVILRPYEDKQELVIVPSLPAKQDPKIWLNVLLFALTFLSVLFAGALFSAEVDPFLGRLTLQGIFNFLWQGWPFAVSFLAILAAHEFGHYFVGRLHKVNVSLPFFIPFPLSMIGTMGAFINMKEPPKNRKHLLDIGIAGPLSGLVVTIVVLFIGLSLSSVEPIPSTIPEGITFQIEGNSLFYLFAKYLAFGKLLPEPVSYMGSAPFLYWLRYFFTGQPAPLGGLDVIIHPVAWAGWAGLLVTMLNLIPAGQLDGGHVLYVLFGVKKARKILPFILLALVALGFIWSGWWLWVGMIFLFGSRYAEPLDQITPLDARRKALAALTLVIFLLIFMPVPFVIVGG